MVDRIERRWLWIIAVLVIVLTAIPYLAGYARQGSAWRFTGFVFGVEDGNSYIAKMGRGADGDWLFRTPYTASPQSGELVFLPYILLGKLAGGAGLHEQLVALFQLFRFVGVILYVFATYDFLAVFIYEVRWRRIGTLVAVFGGGLGWLTVAGLQGLFQGQLPIDFYSPETFGFLMEFGLPHLACARAFLLWGLRDYLTRPGITAGWRGTLKSFLLWTGAGLMQPLSVVTGWAVIATHVLLTSAWQAWRRQRHQPVDWLAWKSTLLRAIWTGLISAPLIVYTFLAFQLDPFLRTWQAQNRLPSPDIGQYLLGFALLLPFAVLGVRRVVSGNPWHGWLVAGWAVIFPLLAYAPVTVQRRLPDGTWVALIVLALAWLEQARPAWQRWVSRLSWLAYLSSAVLILGAMVATWNPSLPVFRPVQEVKAFDYIAAHPMPGTTVLAAFETSNALPAWTGATVISGHGPESVNAEGINLRVRAFYQSSETDADRQEFLKEFRVSYVFWGRAEQAIGDWNPGRAGYLRPVFENDVVQIFAVQPGGGE